jgi:TolB-like protein
VTGTARGRTPRRAPALVAAGAALLLAGCAGAPPVRHSAVDLVPRDHPRAALLPFENLSGREEQADLFRKVFFAKLSETGAFQMVEPGQVDAVLDSLRLRAAGGSLALEDLRRVSAALNAPCLLLGSVLESGTVRAGDADVPSAGAALRLVDTRSGNVLWAGVHFRTGEDRETVFGWGRETDPARLIATLADDMLADFRRAGEAAQSRLSRGDREEPR